MGQKSMAHPNRSPSPSRNHFLNHSSLVLQAQQACGHDREALCPRGVFTIAFTVHVQSSLSNRCKMLMTNSHHNHSTQISIVRFYPTPKQMNNTTNNLLRD